MEKDAIRTQIWDRLADEGIARFPFPPHGRIPNFDGAAEAAERLADDAWWREAETIKCNPDAPQRPVRARALTDGKTVVMAQPRLRSPQPFIRIDPGTIDDPADASTIGGAAEYGQPMAPEAVPPIDAIVAGSVAVDRIGGRIGKGEGYSDLEFAILRELDVIERDVTVATTVHDIQVLGDEIQIAAHDVSLDRISTPTETIHCENRPPRPDGIDWSLVDDERLEAIPVLSTFDNGVKGP